MEEVMRLDRKIARFEPEARFESPQQLAEEVGLTRGEKLAALKRWSDLVDRRLASGNEGMPTRGTEADDAELLRQIEIVRESLQNEAD